MGGPVGQPSGHVRASAQIQQISKNQIIKESRAAAAEGSESNTELNQSGSKVTPRKKIIKLVASTISSGKNIVMPQNASTAPSKTGAQTTKNAKKPSTLDSQQTHLLNNYYQSLQ